MQSTEIIKAEESALTIKAGDLLAQAQRAVIDSPEALEKGTSLGSYCNALLKRAEESRTALTKPLNEVLTEINARYKTISEPAKLAKAVIGDKVVAYRQAEEQRQREAAEAKRRADEAAALELAQQLAEQGKSAEAELVIESAAETVMTVQKIGTVNSQFGGSSHVRDTGCVIEINDLSVVPTQYLMLNESRVKAAWKAGTREITGLKLTQKTTAVFK